jgi:hypothetical protein
MIHFKRECDYFKLGLNLYGAPGGFVAVWVWFDFAKCETFSARFRLRLHRSPRILWSVERVNIIEGYMRKHDLELVQRELLQDTRAAEESSMRRNERFAIIKPEPRA